jgi:hypothetical protein
MPFLSFLNLEPTFDAIPHGSEYPARAENRPAQVSARQGPQCGRPANALRDTSAANCRCRRPSVNITPLIGALALPAVRIASPNPPMNILLWDTQPQRSGKAAWTFDRTSAVRSFKTTAGRRRAEKQKVRRQSEQY